MNKNYKNMKNIKNLEFPDDNRGWTKEDIEEFRKELEIENIKLQNKIKHCYGISACLVLLILTVFKILGYTLVSFCVNTFILVVICILIYKIFKYKEDIFFNNFYKSIPDDLY